MDILEEGSGQFQVVCDVQSWNEAGKLKHETDPSVSHCRQLPIVERPDIRSA
jgi:hypothetical protein